MADGISGADDVADAGADGGSTDAYDAAAWQAELIKLNPWARLIVTEIAGLKQLGLWQGDRNPDQQNDKTRAVRERFAQARLQATLNRWTQPGDSEGSAVKRWNTWAEGMVALKRQLEDGGLWQEEGGLWQEGRFWQDDSEQNRYHSFVFTSFSNLCLPGGSDFTGFIFPGEVAFDGTIFGDKEASPGQAWFDEAQFSGGQAWFDKAQFSGGDAWFDKAQFSGGDASFREAQFGAGRHCSARRSSAAGRQGSARRSSVRRILPPRPGLQILERRSSKRQLILAAVKSISQSRLSRHVFMDRPRSRRAILVSAFRWPIVHFIGFQI